MVSFTGHLTIAPLIGGFELIQGRDVYCVGSYYQLSHLDLCYWWNLTLSAGRLDEKVEARVQAMF